jgi:hypothetical protein
MTNSLFKFPTKVVSDLLKKDKYRYGRDVSCNTFNNSSLPNIMSGSPPINTPDFKNFNDIITFVDPNNSDDWVTIRDESQLPDRKGFIVEKFKDAFPDTKLDQDIDKAYDQIGRLASRSYVINKWLITANLDYSLDAQTPSYLLPYIKPDQFKVLQSNITRLGKLAADESDEINRAAIEYKKKLDSIRDKYSKERDKLEGSNSFLKVLTVPSTYLPLTLQLAIENFTPQNTQNAPTKRAYARELLTDYKIYLLQCLQYNPDLDIDKLIMDNLTK